MKKILFVTPYFGRSGSEMQLLYLLKNLGVKKYEIFLYTRDNGELLSLLPPHIKRFVGYKKHDNFLLRIFRILLYALGINPTEYQLKRIHKKIKPDIWYINTIVNRDAYNVAKNLRVRFIAHIHEMSFSYNLIKAKTLASIIDNAEMCIGCSEMVCEKLKDMGHKNVQLLNGFVDKGLIKVDQNQTTILKKKLGLSDEDFIWIISGGGSLVKGIDLIIPLIKKLKKNHKIIWVGGINNSGSAYYAQRAVEKNFKDRIFFVGSQSNDYYNYFNIGKGFLSLSREDSYPLVMIEAAHLGLPIAGFKSGGINEFVSSSKIGYLSYLNDFEDLAKNMHKIEEEYASIDRAYIQSYANTYNAETQTRLLESIIDKRFNH